MAPERDAEPALWKFFQKLEELQLDLRRYATDIADRGSVIRRRRKPLRSKPRRDAFEESIARYIVQRASEIGCSYLPPRYAIALERRNGLLLYAMFMNLSPRCRVVFLLSRLGRLRPKEIAKRLRIKRVSTVENHLLCAAVEFRRVKKHLYSEGVVKKGV